MKLVIGPGKSGIGDKAVDIHPYPGVTDVVDIAVDALPYDDCTFDEIEASHVLEHVPTVIYWQSYDYVTTHTHWCRRFCRVEAMREIHRVLKSGGVLIASVPGIDEQRGVSRWAQDPTHADVPWLLESFDYFCNQWGGGIEGNEACLSSGIDFGFRRIKHQYSEDKANLTVWLQKS